jgi:hypothetical protein
MKDYRQGAFRNAFEQHLFETVRDALAWCASYAAKEGFPRSVKGEVYHNVQTAEFHGELSVAASRADTSPSLETLVVSRGTDGSIRLVPAVSQTNSEGCGSWLRNRPPPIRTPCRQMEVTKN